MSLFERSPTENGKGAAPVLLKGYLPSTGLWIAAERRWARFHQLNTYLCSRPTIQRRSWPSDWALYPLYLVLRLAVFSDSVTSEPLKQAIWGIHCSWLGAAPALGQQPPAASVLSFPVARSVVDSWLFSICAKIWKILRTLN